MRRAALPMYDWPETRSQTVAFWDRLRAGLELPALSHPTTMTDLLALWRDPQTLIADACRGTVDLDLIETQRIIGRRSYDGVPGGGGTTYRSALVAREGREADPGEKAVLPAGLDRMRLAANSVDSRSGWLAIAEDAGRDAEDVLWTGAHRASIRAVAEGQADLAAIDCRSWQLALAHEPAARALTVIGWTAPRPGHFFMTGTATPDEIAESLTLGLVAAGQYAPETADA